MVAVPRDRIELSTHGFSVHSAASRNTRGSYRAARTALGMSPAAADRLSETITAIARRLARGQLTELGAARLCNQATRAAYDAGGLRAPRAAGPLARTGLRSALARGGAQ